MELQITKRQAAFINADADEVLFGGAAGGGKSMAQMIDAMIFALKYPGSRQLIMRRTYQELEKSLIRMAQELYPRSIFKYNATKYTGKFKNGSTIDFGHCHTEDDVHKYQSAEYDIIRIDELTHFSEYIYKYLRSRIRGTNGYPKMIKCSTNPGNIGHGWVKRHFVDIGEPDKIHRIENSNRLYLPAQVQDNTFLMKSDPDYVNRLKSLPETQRKALLKGDWDIFEGQYFTEWDRDIHVVRPFPIPDTWERYFTIDYGLDMTAAYWIAMDGAGNAYVYREFYQSDLIVSEAAEAIVATDKIPDVCFGPPDLWNRRQDTGNSAAFIFGQNGIMLTKTDNNRVQGWLELREWLRPQKDEFGGKTPKLRVFSSCINLIRCMPALTIDKLNPNDVARDPHEYTHGPDAIRYFVAGRPGGRRGAEDNFDREVEEFLDYGG